MKQMYMVVGGAILIGVFMSPASAGLMPIANDSVWRDTDGNEVCAQGGSMMKIGDIYYWYGFDGEPPLPKSGVPSYKAVKCYSSKDLSRWKFENTIFNVRDKVPNRLDVVYCPATKKYVMISKHMDSKKGAGVSTCDTPTGTFAWQGWLELPDSMGGGDQSIFVDDDGKVYFVYTPWRLDPVNGKVETNKHMTCVELTPDLLKVARIVCHLTNTHLEAPAIFKRNGKYYWMASQVAWWYSSGTSWCMADKLEGPWTPFKKMLAKRPAGHPLAQQMVEDSYNSQHDFVVPVKGSAGTFYMYCGDRYSNYTTLGVGRVVWLPLQFEGDVPVLDWHRTWCVDAVKGTWSAEVEGAGLLDTTQIITKNMIVKSTNAAPAIVPDTVWLDAAGNEILAQGGCVIKAADMFYWYGVEFSGETPKQVRCYSSSDLVSWKYEKPVLAQHVSRRVRVLQKPGGKQFVMFTREGKQLGVSVSVDPLGPFEWKGATDLPEAVGAGDISAFLDEDGKAYIVYTAGAGSADKKETIIIAELKPDWTETAQVVQQFKDVSYESPALWKHGGFYYCTASGIQGWFSSSTAYATASSVKGPWRPWKGIEKGGRLNAQHNMVFEVKGSQESMLVFMGDRWSQFTEYGVGKQVWLPMEFDAGKPVITWYRPWYPDVKAGVFVHDLRRYGLWRDPPKKKAN